MAPQQFTKPAIKSAQVMLSGGNLSLIITVRIKIITCIKSGEEINIKMIFFPFIAATEDQCLWSFKTSCGARWDGVRHTGIFHKTLHLFITDNNCLAANWEEIKIQGEPQHVYLICSQSNWQIGSTRLRLSNALVTSMAKKKPNLNLSDGWERYE